MLRKKNVPIIALKGLVVFPFMILHFDVSRPGSIAALEQAMSQSQLVFLVSQRDTEVDDPEVGDLYDVGTLCQIKQLLKLPGNHVRIMVEGICRAKIKKVVGTEPFISCDLTHLKSIEYDLEDVEMEALVRQLHDVFERFFKMNPKISPEVFTSISEMDEAGQLADLICANFITKVNDRQSILGEIDVKERIATLIVIIKREMELISAEHDILMRVKSQVDKNQREYYLREQMKAISTELSDTYGNATEIDEYKQKINETDLPDEVRIKCAKELERLEKMHSQSPEGSVIRTYLDLLLELPWNVTTVENTNLKRAQTILNRDHYGLDKVKTRIIEHLAVRTLSREPNALILCLVGPPGVGKTSIARSVAEALNRNYTRISLGGIRDEAEIRGHRRTYIGAMPGRIINAVKTANSSNALILLDEVDKLSSDIKGDPSSALLEVLDPEQNKSFRDHYIELPFDLSNILFLTTANDKSSIPRPLLDRMEVIDVPSYTAEEKLNIARKHLLPKQISKHGLDAFKISRSAIVDIITYYTREAGVRNLERELSAAIRRGAVEFINTNKPVSVTPGNLAEYLGKRKFQPDKAGKKDEIGVVTGLCWTPVGGGTLSIEVNVMQGNGKLVLTGNLGDVFKESANAALSYIRTVADKLYIDADFYRKCDIHIHVPEGATPKDGPSAGITMATAIVSALTGRAASAGIAMTGEITIRGRVLAVGGIKEKLLAAYRIGITNIILPKENEKDLDEIPKNIRAKMNFSLCDNAFSVFNIALSNRVNPAERLKFSEIPIRDESSLESSSWPIEGGALMADE